MQQVLQASTSAIQLHNHRARLVAAVQALTQVDHTRCPAPLPLQEAVQLKNMFMAKIEPIMEERRRLNVQIQANLPQVRGTGTTQHVGAGGTAARSYLAATAA